jgi:hypothetical protein
MYPKKKSWLHITIQNFTLHHFIWFLSYDMKKVGLCVLATYAMPWFFISGCWSRLRYADGKNVGPQSPSRIGDSLHHRAVTIAQKCFWQDFCPMKILCDCTTKSVLYGVNRGGINAKVDDFFISGCWSRLRHTDGKNVGPQSLSSLGDSLQQRAVTSAQKCSWQDIVQWKILWLQNKKQFVWC